MEERIAVLGFGIMGEALVKSMVSSGVTSKERLVVTDAVPERLKAASQYGVRSITNNAHAVSGADVVIIAVKPQNVPALAEEIRTALDKQTIISIAAGISTAYLEDALGVLPVIRVMPNICCTVSKGVLAVSRGRYVQPHHMEIATRLLGPSGEVIPVQETLMDGVTGLSGSGPAFMFVILEALADAGVRVGFDRRTSMQMAAWTMLGSAELVLGSGKHPAELKDMVTSPGGTAIAGIHALEKAGIRAAIIDAVQVAAERSAELGQKAASHKTLSTKRATR